MKVISAFPCLGKTTLDRCNYYTVLDREFRESKSTRGMDEDCVKMFFEECAKITASIYEANVYKVMCITDDERLLEPLLTLKPEIKDNLILVFPDLNDRDTMWDYTNRAIHRSGVEWYNDVIQPFVPNFEVFNARMKQYKNNGFDVRFTTKNKPFIWDVVELPSDVIIPNVGWIK